MALVNLYLVSYNNYFNKIFKRPENHQDIGDYIPYATVKEEVHNTAFNENDGVTAYHVINKDIDDVGDYLLVCDNYGTIISRWFITEAKRTRSSQCMLTLQRDLIADYYDTIKTAPAFIERGMLSNDDPMIFNDEGLTFNQIKTDVKPLWDETQMGWIVGYMEKDADITDATVEADVSISSTAADYEWASWSAAPQVLQDIISGTKKYLYNNTLIFSINNIGYIKTVNEANEAYYIDKIYCEYFSRGSYNDGQILANDFVLRADGTVATGRSTPHALRNVNIQRASGTNAIDSIHTSEVGLYKAINDNFNTIKTSLSLEDQEVKNTIDEFNGKIVKVAGTYYKLELQENNETLDVDLSTASFTGAMISKFFSVLKPNRHGDDIVIPNTDWIKYVNQNGQTISSASSSFFGLTRKSIYQTLSANQLGQKAVLSFPTHENRQHTIDAQYDMFAIPLPLNNFGENGVKRLANQSGIWQYSNIRADVSIAIAQKLAVLLDKKLYDIQLLPYCPFDFQFKTTAEGFREIMYVPLEGIACKYVKLQDDATGTARSFIYFCEKSAFERDIRIDYTNQDLQKYEIPLSSDSKSQKNTMKYRISGGNYASMFDFTPDMNGGVNYFKAYCNYKPYKPFIKVNPLFGYLYGKESFRDANGCILSGDFSLTVLSDAWISYLTQNKNFEAMFDRQIQTVEKTNDVNLTNSIFGAMAGTLGGTATGAIAGGMKGGPYGAIAGAVVGGVSSGVGGAIDVNNQYMLMQDNLDLQRTMHSYQIDNIKALPDTIQKISSLTLIDKIVPVLEKFECTDKEKQFFADYIKYNGMSIGRIDKIGNFEERGGFIQGRFIRLEGLSEDYHLAHAINTTFQAGFYFQEKEE